MAEPRKTLQGTRQLWGPQAGRISVLSRRHQGQTTEWVGDRITAGIDKEKHISEVKSDSCRLSCPSQKCPAEKHEGSRKKGHWAKAFRSSLALGTFCCLFCCCKSSWNPFLFAARLPAPSCKSTLHARSPTATITNKLTAFSSNYYLKNMGLMLLQVQASTVVCFELCETGTYTNLPASHFCSTVFI